MDQAYLKAYQEAEDEGMEGVAVQEYAEVVSAFSGGKDPFHGDRKAHKEWHDKAVRMGLSGWPKGLEE